MENEKRNYAKISEMLKDTGSSPEFLEKYRNRVAESQLLKQLIVMRCRRGKTQKDLSGGLKCSQSRISKIESGADDDLTIGYLKKYLEAIDYNLVITLVPKETPAVGQIKYHASEIERNMALLVQIAGGGDASIGGGIGRFFGESLYNLVNLVARQTAKLPANQRPFEVQVVQESPIEERAPGTPDQTGDRSQIRLAGCK